MARGRGISGISNLGGCEGVCAALGATTNGGHGVDAFILDSGGVSYLDVKVQG